jgi:hypothetical protein
MIVVGCFGFANWKIPSKDDIKFIEREKKITESIKNCSYYFPDWVAVAGGDHPCKMQKANGNTIAVIGDSHAGHLYIGLSEQLGEEGGIAEFDASCAAPYLDISSGTSGNDPVIKRDRGSSYKLINSAYNYIANDKYIETVVLAHYPGCSYNDIRDMRNLNNADRDIILRDGVKRTFNFLLKANKKVLVLFDNPRVPFDPKQCSTRMFVLSEKSVNRCKFPSKTFNAYRDFLWYKSIVSSVIEEYPQISSYDLSDLFCDDESCYLSKNGNLLYRDNGHLSYEGSTYVAQFIIGAISQLNR